jgi:hypothetical protein
MRKILFLDHDGVICLYDNWGSRLKSKNKFDDFDKGAIKVLNKIIEKTDCEIVVSSDWRYHGTLEELQQLYRDWGISKVPISVTLISPFQSTSILERARASDIKQWVDDNLTENDRWVAVDDLNMDYYIKENFVWTPRDTEGIKQKGIKNKIIKKLNNEK